MAGHGLDGGTVTRGLPRSGQSPEPASPLHRGLVRHYDERTAPAHRPTSCHRARRDRTMPLDQIGERRNAIGIVILGTERQRPVPKPLNLRKHSPVAVRKFACPSLQLIKIEGCGCARVFDAGGLAALCLQDKSLPPQQGQPLGVSVGSAVIVRASLFGAKEGRDVGPRWVPWRSAPMCPGPAPVCQPIQLGICSRGCPSKCILRLKFRSRASYRLGAARF